MYLTMEKRHPYPFRASGFRFSIKSSALNSRRGFPSMPAHLIACFQRVKLARSGRLAQINRKIRRRDRLAKHLIKRSTTHTWATQIKFHVGLVERLEKGQTQNVIVVEMTEEDRHCRGIAGELLAQVLPQSNQAGASI